MKTKNTFAILLPFFLLFIGCAKTEVEKLEEGFDKEKMDLFFTTIEEKNLGMGSISIFKNRQQEYKTAFGQADIENSIVATTETKYRIASITKTFTASMIMQLIEENKLSLTTLLSDYFPQIPNADKITIELLLRHRSGLFNYTDKEFTVEEVERSRTREEILETFIENGTIFEPNERAEYSNTNYMMLTFILEDIEEREYAEVLNDRIIGPLQLSNTYYGGTINTNNKEAVSYFLENDDWVLARETHISNARGTGGIVSTPTDVGIFYEALFEGKIVSESSLDQMKALVDNFGMGIFPIPFYDKIGFGHVGRIDGFQSMTIYFPSDKVTVTYNTNGENMLMNDIMIGVLSIYSGVAYDLP